MWWSRLVNAEEIAENIPSVRVWYVTKAIFPEEADHRRNARLFKVGGVDDKNLFSLDC